MLHDKHLREREHFILKNGLSDSIRIGRNRLLIHGRIDCQGNTYLQVKKIIKRLPGDRAETIEYAYHGGVSFPKNRNIFRFDNAHGVHEHHVFDPVTGAELGLPRELTRDEWPHLSECLDMLEAWCLQHGSCADSEAE